MTAKPISLRCGSTLQTPSGSEGWAERFQERRRHLRAVAYRILGSVSEADDVLQEAWLRLSRSDASSVENLGGWFTTIVARVSLNMLRARKAKREEPLEGRIPDPIVSPPDGTDPEHEALIGDSLGLALLVVLESLAPAERVAFVLHDMFGVPFEEIATITERSPAAVRQLASRARRRVQAQARLPDPDLTRQWSVVEAFSAASRDGNFDALVAVLDPDILLREDNGTRPGRASLVVRGARAVTERAMMFSHLGAYAHRALVNGAPGVVVIPEGRPFAVMAFTVSDGRIVEIDVLNDPARLSELKLPTLD
ncbi:MAG TPA: sigma-70 family RNA polymerase sigma factor [Solirubrobacteraceae bacterium]|nr:sigma-70 family RNA polymerase sigma factor [Solirubrobacteraceae bacterium]